MSFSPCCVTAPVKCSYKGPLPRNFSPEPLLSLDQLPHLFHMSLSNEKAQHNGDGSHIYLKVKNVKVTGGGNGLGPV